MDSLWLESSVPKFPSLERDLEVDVVVIGGGITGLTAAWLLRHAGRRVAVVERARLGAADTGHTTAHLTHVTDTSLHELTKRFGKEGARAAWEAGKAAIDQIEAIIEATGAECNFRRLPGYLHAPRGEPARSDATGQLQKDAELAHELGFDSRFEDSVPVFEVPGVRFADQATFDPGKYLAALARDIVGQGSHVFEGTRIESVEGRTRVVAVGGHAIRCEYVVIATHNPLSGSLGSVTSGLFQTKLSLYTSYVLGARVALNTLPDALFWESANPYDYLRIEGRADHQLMIFGGADLKTGQGDDEAAYAELQRRLLARLPDAQITHRWLGQVIETDDGLPYIGEHADGEFIATGYAGNGMTWGTLAAMMARDAAVGRDNPWTELLRVNRKPAHGGLWRYLRENIDYPKYLIADRLTRSDTRSLSKVPAGEGRVVALESGRVAAYRDPDGALMVCSAVCTHMKCLVRWNQADRTWDCPCHGSRFSTNGEVMSGPAETPLDRI
jgi:glycine/D-amino acid oxidase-like deaminating enzyme/nitrite reductase/ring-hydroxylating ferredoxin subunit